MSNFSRSSFWVPYDRHSKMNSSNIEREGTKAASELATTKTTTTQRKQSKTILKLKIKPNPILINPLQFKSHKFQWNVSHLLQFCLLFSFFFVYLPFVRSYLLILSLFSRHVAMVCLFLSVLYVVIALFHLYWTESKVFELFFDLSALHGGA